MLIDIDGAIGGKTAPEDDTGANNSNTNEISDEEVDGTNNNDQVGNEESQDGDSGTMTDEEEGKTMDNDSGDGEGDEM